MKRQFIAILMTALLCLSVFGSVFCMASHAHHDCTGEGCAVCAVLEQCGQRLHGASAAASAVPVLLFFAQHAVCLCAAAARELSGSTPVALKVKLLN